MNMELRTLYYFLMVAREENITRAALRLHMGQPALSRQLMQLEDEIGKQLLIRGKRKIQLTEAGMLLRRRAEEIIDLVDKTESELINNTDHLTGEIMIGMAECFASQLFLPKLIKSFSQKYSDVTYDFYTGNADLIKERLDQGLIDVGILLEPVDLEKYDYIRLPQKERWGIVVSNDNPLSQNEYVTSQELIGIPLLNTKRSIVQNEIASWFKNDYQKLHFIATYNFLSNTIPLVAEGLGSVITIEGAFYNHLQKNIKFIPFYPELLTGTVFVWKKHQTLSPLLSQFIETIYHAIKE